MKNIYIDKQDFYEWLVGLTDGDGCFSINIQKNSLCFTYKISLSTNNLQLLYYIKSELKIGSVTIEKNRKMASFRVRDSQKLNDIILPIFEKYPLFTKKYYDFIYFKEALNFKLKSQNNKDDVKEFWILAKKKRRVNETPLISPRIYKNLTPDQVDSFFINLDKFYDSKNCSILLDLIKIYKLNLVFPKFWVIGFIEAEGSFFFVKKDANQIIHSFGIIQKEDPLILAVIKSIFHIPTKLQFKCFQYSNNIMKNEKLEFIINQYYSLETTNSRAIENIIHYFSGKNKNKTNMKGFKSLEYRIWARSYVKYKGNFDKLLKIQKLLKNLREKLKE